MSELRIPFPTKDRFKDVILQCSEAGEPLFPAYEQNSIEYWCEYAVVSYWYYAEIGFSSTDMFVQRFKTRFNICVKSYSPIIKRMLDGKPYSGYTRNTSTSNNKTTTPNNITTKTERRGDDGFTSDNTTDLKTRASQNSLETANRNTTTIWNSDITETKTNTNKIESYEDSTNDDMIDYSPDNMLKAIELNVFDRFVHEFDNLFMGVYDIP